MKGIVLLSCILFCSIVTSGQIVLKRGTNIYIELATEANSNNRHEIIALVGYDVLDTSTGEILITKGTPVRVRVERRKSRGLGKAGWLLIKPISTTAIDGKEILLDGIYSKEGEDRKGLALGLGIGSGLTYLPGLGFLFLLIKGEKIILPKGSILYDIYIGENYQFYSGDINSLK